MPTPKLTTSKSITTHVDSDVVRTRTPDYLDILTVLLPVLTFLLGYYLTSIVENRKEKKRLTHVKEYFLAQAEFLALMLNNQSAEIKLAIKKIDTMAIDNVSSKIYAELNVTRIRSLSYLDQYKIFIGSKRNSTVAIKNLNTVSASLDFIDAAPEEIRKLNAHMIGEIVSYKEIYFQNINNLISMNTSFNLKNKEYKTSGELEFSKLNKIFSEIVVEYGNKVADNTLSKIDLIQQYEQLIKPLFDKTRGIIATSETLAFIEIINRLYNNYEEFLKAKATTKNGFNDIVNSFDLIVENLMGIRSIV